MMFAFAALLLSLTFTSSGVPAQAAAAQTAATPLAEELWAAARAGDAARVTAALDKGVDVNTKTRYGATALTFAADKGHLEIVKLLITRGADVNLQDTFYQMRAIDMAMMNNRTRAELRGHGRDAGGRQRRGLRDRRLSAGAARVRDQAERERRDRARQGRDQA